MSEFQLSLESCLRDTPHLYLKATEVAFAVVSADLAYIALKEVIAHRPANVLLYGGMSAVSGSVAAVHGKLAAMKRELGHSGNSNNIKKHNLL